MANPDRRGDFNRLQAELFHRTTSTNRKRRNKPSTQSSVTTKPTTFLVSIHNTLLVDIDRTLQKDKLYLCIVHLSNDCFKRTPAGSRAPMVLDYSRCVV